MRLILLTMNNLVHGIVSETNNFDRSINSAMFKRPGGPKRPDRAKKHNGASGSVIVNCANEAKCKSTITVVQSSKGNSKINNEHKTVLPMNDFRDHLDQLHQILQIQQMKMIHWIGPLSLASYH